jgi:hypothetical protein
MARTPFLRNYNFPQSVLRPHRLRGTAQKIPSHSAGEVFRISKSFPCKPCSKAVAAQATRAVCRKRHRAQFIAPAPLHTSANALASVVPEIRQRRSAP